LINDFYSDGKEFVIDENAEEPKVDFDEIEQKIIKILDQKIRPAVARDGGDIKFKEFKDGGGKSSAARKLFGMPKFYNDSKTRCSKSLVPLFARS
jgi:hypothetical protein